MDPTDRLRRIAAWEARLSAPDFTIGSWVLDDTDNGVQHMPWFRYSEEAERLIRDFAPLIEVFDWMTWARTPRGQELTSAPEAIGSATLEELGRLVTAILRGDRFVEGNIAGAFKSGFLTAIARRAGALADAADE